MKKLPKYIRLTNKSTKEFSILEIDGKPFKGFDSVVVNVKILKTTRKMLFDTKEATLDISLFEEGNHYYDFEYEEISDVDATVYAL